MAWIMTWVHSKRRTLGWVEHLSLDQASDQARQTVAEYVHSGLPAPAKSKAISCTLEKKEAAGRLLEEIPKIPETVKRAFGRSRFDYWGRTVEVCVLRQIEHSTLSWVKKTGVVMGSFSTDFVSPTNFDSLAVEISYDSQILCRINRESADGTLEIEFFHEARLLADDVNMKFPVLEFLSAVEEACVDLREIS